MTPVYAGADYLRELVQKLAEMAAEWERDGVPLQLGECIFVDDGSGDGSAAVLADLAAEYPFVTVVTLSRNFGQHPATVAGVLHSSGDWVVTLDEDLQHEPRHVLRLVEEVVAYELDVVYANSSQPVQHSRLRDWGSRGLKSALVFLTGNRFIRLFNSFRVARGSIARAAASVSSHATYFDVALCWYTQRIGSLKVPMTDVRYTERGQSGYDVRKLFSHARRLLITLQTNWLRLGAFLGVGALAFSVVLGLWLLVQTMVAPESIEVRGWLSLFMAILFFGGLTTSLVGVVLEYLSTVVLHTQGKPTFFVVDRSKDDILREYFSLRAASAAADSRS